MKSAKKKKKRSKMAAKDESSKEERIALDALMEAFSLASVEDVISAYKEAKGDANRAAEVLAGLAEDGEYGRVNSSGSTETSSSVSRSGSFSVSGTSNSGSCSVSGTSSSVSEGGSCSSEGASCSSEGSAGCALLENEFGMKNVGWRKPKKVIAATGTVSTVLGKDYVMSKRKGDSLKQKESGNNEPFSREDMEQFLCSMLGDESELGLPVVQDILCNCGYDVEKSLDALLKLCDPEQTNNGRYCNQTRVSKDVEFLTECNDFLDGVSDSTSHSSESEFHDSVQSIAYGHRNYAEVLAGSKASFPTGPKSSMVDPSQEVLESLFHIPKSAEKEPSTMNWKDVVKKVESLGQRVNFFYPEDKEPLEKNYVKGKEYHAFRKNAMRHWESMRTFYRRAAFAYSSGDRQSASYLSEQGKLHNKMAQNADEKASKEIYKARNKDIKNVITIDLHGQHVKQAMSLLKVHLLFGTYVHSIQLLRVITGCGTNGVGKSKLKQSVIKLLDKEGVEWKEENPGSLIIKVDAQKELSFVDSEYDSD